MTCFPVYLSHFWLGDLPWIMPDWWPSFSEHCTLRSSVSISVSLALGLHAAVQGQLTLQSELEVCFKPKTKEVQCQNLMHRKWNNIILLVSIYSSSCLFSLVLFFISCIHLCPYLQFCALIWVKIPARKRKKNHVNSISSHQKIYIYEVHEWRPSGWRTTWEPAPNRETNSFINLLLCGWETRSYHQNKWITMESIVGQPEEEGRLSTFWLDATISLEGNLKIYNL